MNSNILQGIIPAMVTPLGASGKELDEGAARNLVEFLISHEVNGLFALGSTGEFAYLSAELRQRMAALVIRHARGRVPVVIQVGAPTMEEVIVLAKHAAAIGADGIALAPPTYYSLDDAALERFYAAAAESVDIPIYLYNIPANAKNQVSVPLFSKLSKAYPHIAGMKDSSMNFDNFYELVQAKESRHAALIGNDAQILPALAVGGQGAVSASATAIPEPYVSLYRACRNQDWEEARRWQAVCARIKKMMVKPYPIAPQKQVLEWRGVAGSSVMAPLRRMSQAETEQLLQEYESIQDQMSK